MSESGEVVRVEAGAGDPRFAKFEGARETRGLGRPERLEGSRHLQGRARHEGAGFEGARETRAGLEGRETSPTVETWVREFAVARAREVAYPAASHSLRRSFRGGRH